MLQIANKIITLAEFLQIPETKPVLEYIDGKIIEKPMPQGQHSIIQTELTPAINTVLKPSQIGRAFTELRCTFGGRSIVPDITVFLRERIPRYENGKIANSFLIAPDWTIEILSPEQNQIKVTKNILHCLKYGTKLGWLIAPEDETVLVFYPQQQIEVCEEINQLLPVPDFASNFQLTVGDLFSWLLDF